MIYVCNRTHCAYHTDQGDKLQSHLMTAHGTDFGEAKEVIDIQRTNQPENKTVRQILGVDE